MTHQNTIARREGTMKAGEAIAPEKVDSGQTESHEAPAEPPVEMRKRLEGSARRLKDMRRFAPRQIVAQIRQGLSPDSKDLKLLSDYLKELEAFETGAEQVIGLSHDTR